MVYRPKYCPIINQPFAVVQALHLVCVLFLFTNPFFKTAFNLII